MPYHAIQTHCGQHQPEEKERAGAPVDRRSKRSHYNDCQQVSQQLTASKRSNIEICLKLFEASKQQGEISFLVHQTCLKFDGAC